MLIWALVILVMVLLLAAAFYIWATKQRTLTVLASFPEQVMVGTKFKVEVQIINPARKAQTFEFLDVENSFMNHCELIGVLPRAKSITLAMGSTAIFYKRKLEPETSMVAELHFSAARPGKAVGRFAASNSRLLPGESALVSVSVIGSPNWQFT